MSIYLKKILKSIEIIIYHSIKTTQKIIYIYLKINKKNKIKTFCL